MDRENALQELDMIKRTIEDSRKLLIDNGVGLLLWGVISSIGLIITYLLVMMRFDVIIAPLWGVLVAGGWIFNYFAYYRKKSKPEPYKPFGARILGGLWVAIGVAMCIFGFLATATGALSHVFITAALSTLLGSSFFTSAYIFDLNWMKAIGVGWWIGAVVMFVWPGAYTLLLMALMLILFQIVPGMIFYRRFQKAKREEHE